jgi:hypothetical protein
MAAGKLGVVDSGQMLRGAVPVLSLLHSPLEMRGNSDRIVRGSRVDKFVIDGY